jgi:hypothetical protein
MGGNPRYKDRRGNSHFRHTKTRMIDLTFYPKRLKKTPAAIAVPITPATLGPIACINKKLPGSSSCPTFCDTRAAIGTAETPADPIRGLILLFKNRFINLAINTPDAVDTAKAAKPKAIIPRVSAARKYSALAVAPTVIPKKIVTILIREF